MRKEVKVYYFPKWTVFPLVVGFVYFHPFKVTVGLCKKHSSQFREDLKINLPLVLLGISCFIGSWLALSFSLLGLGLLLFFVGCLRSLLGADPVRLQRYKQPHLWLKGAGKPYLASLKDLPLR